jgi:hypothetical protein
MEGNRIFAIAVQVPRKHATEGRDFQGEFFDLTIR